MKILFLMVAGMMTLGMDNHDENQYMGQSRDQLIEMARKNQEEIIALKNQLKNQEETIVFLKNQLVMEDEINQKCKRLENEMAMVKVDFQIIYEENKKMSNIISMMAAKEKFYLMDGLESVDSLKDIIKNYEKKIDSLENQIKKYQEKNMYLLQEKQIIHDDLLSAQGEKDQIQEVLDEYKKILQDEVAPDETFTQAVERLIKTSHNKDNKYKNILRIIEKYLFGILKWMDLSKPVDELTIDELEKIINHYKDLINKFHWEKRIFSFDIIKKNKDSSENLFFNHKNLEKILFEIKKIILEDDMPNSSVAIELLETIIAEKEQKIIKLTAKNHKNSYAKNQLSHLIKREEDLRNQYCQLKNKSFQWKNELDIFKNKNEKLINTIDIFQKNLEESQKQIAEKDHYIEELICQIKKKMSRFNY
jgi:hypothetical protein